MPDSAPEPRPPSDFLLPGAAADRGWSDFPSLAAPALVEPRLHKRDRAPLIVMAALFATANAAILPLTDVFQQRDWGAVWVYLSAGLMAAQAGALPFWLVFGRESFLARLVVFWAAAVGLFACWGVGLLVWQQTSSHRFSSLEVVHFFVLSLPLAALAIQLPLWPLKLYFGWSLVCHGEMKPAPSDRPLAISDYLLGTALVAISVGLARLAPDRLESAFWLAWLIFAASVAGTSLVSVVPAMLLMLRPTGGRRGAAFMLAYALGAAGITVIITAAVNPNFRRQLSSSSQWWELVGGLLVFLAFAAGLSGAMLATRALGYRLTFGGANGASQERQPLK